MQGCYSIPGKVFLLGEYAVLAQLPGLVATVGPRFGLASRLNPTSLPKEFVPHPESPLGRLYGWAQARKPGFQLSFEFQDPFEGAGGFGASTAQFAMAYLALAQQSETQESSHLGTRWNHAWQLYRELMKDEPLIPSGADLVAQWEGGVVFFDPSDEHCMDLWPLFNWASLLVFSATGQSGRKVPTHRHLESLAREGFPGSYHKLTSTFEKILIQGISAIQENRAGEFGEAMDRYADALHGVGLEVSATTEDRQILRNLPGVLGVKGAGALQADSVLVLMKPECTSGHPDRNQVIHVAESRGLKLLCDGLTCQIGITCQYQGSEND